MDVFSPAPPRAVLRHGVAAMIRNAILDGMLPLGSPLVEVQIARQMGISRAPLREALRQLEREGLVVTVEHRGAFVATLTEADIEEISSLRAALECFAVRRVFKCGNVGVLATGMAARIEKMADYVRAGDVRQAQREDFGLHEDIIRASAHSRLLSAWETMLGQIRLAFRAFHQHPEYPGFDNLPDRHRVILAALQNGDGPEAEAVVHEHIMGPGNALMWVFRTRAPKSRPSYMNPSPERVFPEKRPLSQNQSASSSAI